MPKRNTTKITYKEAKNLELLLDDLEIVKKENPSVKSTLSKACPLIFGKTKWDKIKDDEKRMEYLSRFNDFFPAKPREFISTVLFTFSFLNDEPEDEMVSDIINLKAMITDCKKLISDENYFSNISKWSRAVAERFYGIDAGLLIKDETRTKLYKKIMDSACAAGDELAMYVRGYAAYGGNEIYPCDWKLSERYLMALLDGVETADEEKGFIANSLGYIYYYGRNNSGVPDFDKALKYYTIGAGCGVTESVYKLGDMNLNGLGIPKNIYGAFTQYSRVFNDSKNAFLNGDMNCKLADASLRMGSLCENGLYFKKDDDMAYYFYTIAEYAINNRMKVTDFYGDETVKSNIDRSIERIRTKVSGDDPDMKTYSAPFPEHIVMLLEGGETIEVQWENMKDSVKLTAHRIYGPDQQKPPMLLIVHANAHYCKMVDTVVEYASSIKAFRIKGNMKSFRANSVNINKTTGKFDFYYNGELTACIDAGSFVYRMRD